MNWTWLWVVLGLFLIISPAFWLLPSRRQKGQMAMRLAAGRQGIRVSMVRPDWPHWMLDHVANETAQYTWVRKRASQPLVQFWQVSAQIWHNKWREPLEDQDLLVHLQTLPADVWSIEIGPAAVQLTWAERGEVSGLEAVSQVLKSL